MYDCNTFGVYIIVPRNVSSIQMFATCNNLLLMFRH